MRMPYPPFGFLIGSAVAYALGCGIAVVRKQGKLPAATYNASYALDAFWPVADKRMDEVRIDYVQHALSALLGARRHGLID